MKENFILQIAILNKSYEKKHVLKITAKISLFKYTKPLGCSEDFLLRSQKISKSTAQSSSNPIESSSDIKM